MKKYRVHVEWATYGYIDVEAASICEAEDMAESADEDEFTISSYENFDISNVELLS